MAQFVGRWAVRLAVLFVVVLLSVAGFAFVREQGLLSPFGINSERQDTQVVQAVQRTQEVSLLKLVIQGITSEKVDRELFGQSIPGTRCSCSTTSTPNSVSTART